MSKAAGAAVSFIGVFLVYLSLYGFAVATVLPEWPFTLLSLHDPSRVLSPNIKVGSWFTSKITSSASAGALPPGQSLPPEDLVNTTVSAIDGKVVSLLTNGNVLRNDVTDLTQSFIIGANLKVGDLFVTVSGTNNATQQITFTQEASETWANMNRTVIKAAATFTVPMPYYSPTSFSMTYDKITGLCCRWYVEFPGATAGSTISSEVTLQATSIFTDGPRNTIEDINAFLNVKNVKQALLIAGVAMIPSGIAIALLSKKKPPKRT
jgi:hypothetical protein